MVNLQEIRSFIENQKLKGQDYSVRNISIDDPVILKVGNRVWDGIILEEDIGIELGSNDNPIIKTLISLKDSTDIHNSRITLIGKDLKDISTPSCKFGFLILIGGKNISNTAINKIRRSIYLSTNVEGIFEKQSGRNSWYQLTRKLLDKKLSFIDIGSALMKLIRNEVPENIKIEILMTVENDLVLTYFRELYDLSKIDSIKQFQEKIKNIQKLRPDCDYDWECTVCDNKEICDQVRDMITRRNKMMKG